MTIGSNTSGHFFDTTLNADGVLYATSAGVIASTAVGTSGQVLTSNGAGALPTWQAAGGGSHTLVTTFTSSGMWSINASTKFVEIYAWGGGGGGGGGQVADAATANIFCGLGGCTGFFINLKFLSSIFPATSTITIGAGGTGGAGASSAGGNGTTGTDGGNSTISCNSGVITALGGKGGLGGNTVGSFNMVSSSSSATSSTTVVSNTGIITSFTANTNLTGIASSGGPGGYKLTSLHNAQNGQNLIIGQIASASLVTQNITILSGGTGGTADAQNGTNGTDGSTANYIMGGTGGGGGNYSTLTNAGNGGNGGLRGGGGGGGGACAGALGVGAGGTGGNGGRGEIWIIEYM